MGTYELLVLLSQAVGICELGNMGGSVGRLGDMSGEATGTSKREYEAWSKPADPREVLMVLFSFFRLFLNIHF